MIAEFVLVLIARKKSQIALRQCQVSKNQRWKRPITVLAARQAQCKIVP